MKRTSRRRTSDHHQRRPIQAGRGPATSSRASRCSRRSTAAARAASRSAPRSPTARSPTSRRTTRCRCRSSSGWSCSPRWPAPPAGTTRSPATPTTRRTWRTTPAGAAGRTFPSAAGFHTSELFFTDDSGTWFFPTRDAGALVDPADEEITPELMVERHAERLVKLSDERIHLPREEPYLEGHNTWCVNVPGLAARDPGRRPRAARARGLCFLDAERLLPDRRRERPADPRHGALPRARRRRRPVPAHLLRPVHAGRDHRRARVLLLRGRPDAAGDGPRRLDVRRRRPLLDARRLGQPRGPRARLPLRRGRALVGTQPDRPRGRLRGVLPTAPRRHARRRRRLLRAQVRRRRAAQRRYARRMERVGR